MSALRRRSSLSFGDSLWLVRFGSVAVCAVLFLPAVSFSQRLTPLSPVPDWDRLKSFQETITRDEFVHLLDTIYAPDVPWSQWIQVDAERATILEDASEHFILRFAPSPETAKAVPRYWTAPYKLSPDDKYPLSGLKIAIDPGHL